MKRRVVITGADGFIGRNIRLALLASENWEAVPFTRSASPEEATERLAAAMRDADAVIHLAGVNRTPDTSQFFAGNTEFSRLVAAAVASQGRAIPVIYASSSQAALDNDYGRSKQDAENALRGVGEVAGFPVYLFRLPNVFGKWARPNYNSAVATFCHNLARGLDITVHDPSAPLSLVYIDDVVEAFVAILEGADPPRDSGGFAIVEPVYHSTVGAVAETISGFRDVRENLLIGGVGTGLDRALYATYVSYLPEEHFRYPLLVHEDPRGRFVEMLRTKESGQFSFFTAHPGVTRGGHYHHTKTEKFLVVSGTARFGFRNMANDNTFALITKGEKPEVVDTIPGWTHDITNIGEDMLVVMLWANELFDPCRPDTYACPVGAIPSSLEPGR